MNRRLCLILCISCACLARRAGAADTPHTPYQIESIALPEQSREVEVGGMDWSADGKLVCCTRHGEVWMRSAQGKWALFASGLHEALGLKCGDSSGEVYVLQRPELTRLTDVDGDGKADRFETVCDQWGYNGNYHEFAFGLVRDRDGNLCGTLGLAHKPDESGGAFLGTEKSTPYRGWSFKVTPEGEFVPWSVGLRAPNGIAIDADGELFCTDNQGSWVPTGMLHHLEKGAFHGHPSGLIFKQGWKRPLNEVPQEEYDAMRLLPAVLFPYPQMGQSQGAPTFDTTQGKFGPFAGQMFVGDVIVPIIMRVTLEKVDGKYQGACYPFMRKDELRGCNRLLFGRDGSLWVGITNRGWERGSSGLHRITWNGKVPFDIREMRLTRDGFDLEFTRPVDSTTASDAKAYALSCWRYTYSKKYGSPEVDKGPVKVEQVRLSADGRTVSLKLGEIKARQWVYGLSVEGLKSADGAALANREAFYTVNSRKP